MKETPFPLTVFATIQWGLPPRCSHANPKAARISGIECPSIRWTGASESFELHSKITKRHDYFAGIVVLEPIVVDDDDKIVQLVFDCGLHSFPYLSFLRFPVPNKTEDPILPVVAFAGKRHADSCRQSLPEGSGTDIHSGGTVSYPGVLGAWNLLS